MTRQSCPFPPPHSHDTLRRFSSLPERRILLDVARSGREFLRTTIGYTRLKLGASAGSGGAPTPINFPRPGSGQADYICSLARICIDCFSVVTLHAYNTMASYRCLSSSRLDSDHAHLAIPPVATASSLAFNSSNRSYCLRSVILCSGGSTTASSLTNH